MIITLKDGSKKEYAEAMSAYDIARDISEGLARAACLAEIDGETADLRTIIDKDCELNIPVPTFWRKQSRTCTRTPSWPSDHQSTTASTMTSISRLSAERILTRSKPK